MKLAIIFFPLKIGFFGGEIYFFRTKVDFFRGEIDFIRAKVNFFRDEINFFSRAEVVLKIENFGETWLKNDTQNGNDWHQYVNKFFSVGNCWQENIITHFCHQSLVIFLRLPEDRMSSTKKAILKL